MCVRIEERIEHIIVDTVAFFKRARLETFGTNIYTTPEVLREIKDKQTLQFIKTFSFQICIESPTKESIKTISDLAKKTGDYSVLSPTDISVLALTYELYKRFVGEPTFKEIKPLPSNLGQLARERTIAITTHCKVAIQDNGSKIMGDDKKCVQEESDSALSDDLLLSSPNVDENDWITEENFDERALNNFGLAPSFLEDVFATNSTVSVVGCLTTDFPMQNVLFHAGLEIIALNGLRIRQPRTFLLWCCICFRPTKRTDTYFCPFCGHASLNRIPVTLHDDGNLEFHFSRHYRPCLRGLQQPIRKPQGGKYADEPIYCADQRLPDRRPARRKNVNVMPIASNGLLGMNDEGDDLSETFDFQCNLNNMFLGTFPLNDISSRAAMHGIRSDHQIPRKNFHSNTVEHGLKPSRGSSHLVKHRTGNKRKNKNIA